jgi:inner membrane protein
MALALLTHPILDTFTIYGTQLLQPLSDYPFGIGSLFIIDPAYTVPLLVGVGVALVMRSDMGLRANLWALGLSCLYVVWSWGAQIHVKSLVKSQLSPSYTSEEALLVTPAPLSTLLWRIVIVKPDGYEEGFYSLFDGHRPIRFDRFPTDASLRPQLAHIETVRRMAKFTKGLYKLEVRGNKAVLTDLRMGQEPGYVFAFEVAERGSEGVWKPILPTTSVGRRSADARAFTWLWARMRGHDVPPPR